MNVSIFNTYSFVLSNKEEQLTIIDACKAKEGFAAIEFNPKMTPYDLLAVLKVFQNILSAAIDDLEKEGR